MRTDQIQSHVLQEGDVAITVLSVGCAVQDWVVDGRHVALGYAEPEHYLQNPASMGVICGRVANRIAHSRFTLNGKEYVLPANNGPHHLHGGPEGLGKRIWRMERDGDRAVEFSYTSPDGEQGYPGRVEFSVVMRLDGGRLTYDMTAAPDRETPINLAQHIYFNLNGQEDVWDHRLRIDADAYTPNNSDLIPSGEVVPVGGTKWDFRTPKRLRDVAGPGDGWDGNLVLNAASDQPVAEVSASSGLTLKLWTDRPGLQLYTANALTRVLPEGPGVAHARFGGLCLEAQGYPNAVNVPEFPSVICSPERPYVQRTEIEIG